MKRKLRASIALVLALSVFVGANAFAQAPYSASSGDIRAYLDANAQVRQQGKEGSLGSEINAIVSVDSAQAYCVNAGGELIQLPLDGSDPRVLAEGVAQAVALGGAFYYLDAQTQVIMSVAPGEKPRALGAAQSAQKPLDTDGEKLYYGDQLVDLATGALTASEYTAFTVLDTLMTARQGDNLVVRKLGSQDDWAQVDGGVVSACEIGGTLYYVTTAKILKAYDLATSLSRPVCSMSNGFTGQLCSNGQQLFANTASGDIYRISPTTGASELVIEFATAGDPARLISLGDELMLYSSEDGVNSLLGQWPAPGEEAQPQATVQPEETVEPEETKEPNATPEPEEAEETALEQPVPTIAPTSTPKPEKTPGPSGYAELVRGDEGELIRKLQKRLIELGYLGGGADGDFGRNTEAAVKAFQKGIGWKQSGVATVDLQKKLFAKDAPKASLYRELSKGDSGEDVKNLQKRLKKLGYYAGSEDGKFDSGVEKAVKRFQKAMDWKQTGVATETLQKKLYSKSAPKYSEEEYITLRPGDSGERVKKLQRRLKALGYFTGEIGGNYQTLTTKAVKRFQKEIGEDADGVATVALQRKIFADDAPEYSG